MLYLTAFAALNAAAFAYLLVIQARGHTATVSILADAIAGERADYIALVDRLCQRLQAPEQAVIDHTVSTVLPDAPAVVAMDDDDAHWDNKGVSKEDLADLVMQAELAR